MSEDPSLALTLAGRQLLFGCGCDLLDWCRQRWEEWLEAQRSLERASTPGLVVVAALTCLEDLFLNVGVMQLLSSEGLCSTLILALPTEEMTSLARAKARREGWLTLVHMVPRKDLTTLVQGLSGRTTVVAFTMPAVLGSGELEALSSWCSGDIVSFDNEPLGDGAIFAGSPDKFEEWTRTQQALGQDQLIARVKSVLEQIPTRIPLLPGRVVVAAPQDTELNGSPRMVPAHEGSIELSGLGPDSELIVSSVGDFETGSVVVRQRSDLLGAERPSKIRMPSSFMTISPQRIRVESRTFGVGASTDLMFHVPPSQLQPWMLSAFLNRGGGGNPVIRAFACGVGCPMAYAEDEPLVLRDIPVVWGVLRQSDRMIAQAKAQELYFFYIDHAYFSRGHGKNYRITRNAYEAGAIRKCPADRISDLDVELLPWCRSGREIIVCPPTEYFMQAHGCADWLDKTMETLQRVTDRPIIVRLKPQPGEEVVPLPRALETAHALVTHSSNIAIEAACLGTPVFVAPTSAAAPVGLTDLMEIEAPVYPDREPWLAHLAYNQFSLDEIGDGRAWRMLLELEEREYV